MSTFIKNNSLMISSGGFKCALQPSGANRANWNRCANWNGSTIGNLTTVGTNGGPSAYGTYDQSGNIEEHLENYTGSSTYMFRHAASFDDTANYLAYDTGLIGNVLITASEVQRGFRVASYANPYSYYNFVNICDVNNSSAPNGYGSVSYQYKINKYLITNSDYMEYLIAIATIDAPAGVSGSKVYVNNMRTNISGGINRTQIGGSGSSIIWSYNIRSNMGNKPVNFVSWLMSARYINWLHNGKPSGSQNSSSTENGVYDMSLTIPTRKIGAKYFIPTINEWTKSGFYKGGSTNAGYWTYATQSNTIPTCVSATSIGDGII